MPGRAPSRRPGPGLIHRCVRAQRAPSSAAYTCRLLEAGARKGIRSFFKTLKREEVALNDYRTFAEAEANLDRFIEDMYNRKRLHSSLGYVPPAEFEAAHRASSES